MPVPCELRSTGPQDRCKSARGPDADLRRNILIYFISEGSRFGADSHRREKLLKLLADEEAKIILSSQHDVSPRSAGANPR
jgi:hypothetical protein